MTDKSSRSKRPVATAKVANAKAPNRSQPRAKKTVTASPTKVKRIRGEFSMPIDDYALIAALKSRSSAAGRPVKKNELLRAGLKALDVMSEDALQMALSQLRPVKPKASKPAKK